MKIVIFGLTMSSSWGNGHATLWRALSRALAQRKHSVVFFERDVPYYSAHRDLRQFPYADLILYSQWNDVISCATEHLNDADVGMVTSYCPDGIPAADLVLLSRAGLKIFYDLDAPVTLERIRNGVSVDYISSAGLSDFDLVLSYTGGRALEDLKTYLGARQTAPLYGSVDPVNHYPVPKVEHYQCDLSYLGTYAEDRQQGLEKLFIQPAWCLPEKKFIIGGAQYPREFPWAQNIFFVQHQPPSEHPGFFCSSKLTLNITRRAMAEMGYCPSGRLFEAAACGTPILSDVWEGLDEFFQPGAEILLGREAEDSVRALDVSDEELLRIGRAARERTLDEHTAATRAAQFEHIVEHAGRIELIET